MLCWMSGKTGRGKNMNDTIRDSVGVAPILEKIVENWLIWFEHVERRYVYDVVRIVDQTEVC